MKNKNKQNKPLKVAKKVKESKNYEISLNQEQMDAVIACLAFTSVGDAVLDVVNSSFYDTCKLIVRHLSSHGVKIPRYLSFYAPIENAEDEIFIKEIGGKIKKS